MRRTLVAFFDDDGSAEGAAETLVDVGFDRRGVRLLSAADAGDLAFLGITDPDAKRCAQRLRWGEPGVAVTTDVDLADGAREILDRDGVVEAQAEIVGAKTLAPKNIRRPQEAPGLPARVAPRSMGNARRSDDFRRGASFSWPQTAAG